MKKLANILTLTCLLSIGWAAGAPQDHARKPPTRLRISPKTSITLLSFPNKPGCPSTVPIIDHQICRVTCYSPIEGFHASNYVCRGRSVEYWTGYAQEHGLDGICAVSPATGYYEAARHEVDPRIILVKGHGKYLCVDRTATWLDNHYPQGTIDIWVPDLSSVFAGDREIKSIGGNYIGRFN